MPRPIAILSSHSPTKLFGALLVAGMCFTTLNASAQTSSSPPDRGLHLVDWEFTAGTHWLAAPDAVLSTGRLQGRVPLESLLPQVTADSRMRFLALAAGTRGANGKQQSSWHATLLDLRLQRAWWSGAVVLADLQSNTFLDRDRTWIEFGTGPGMHFQRSNRSLSSSLQLFGGRRSARVPTLDDSRLEGSGWHGGVRVQAGLRVGRLIAHAAWSRSDFSSGNTSLDETSILIGMDTGERWQVSGIYRHRGETGPEGAMDGPATSIGMEITYRVGRN